MIVTVLDYHGTLHLPWGSVLEIPYLTWENPQYLTLSIDFPLEVNAFRREARGGNNYGIRADDNVH